MVITEISRYSPSARCVGFPDRKTGRWRDSFGSSSFRRQTTVRIRVSDAYVD
jgi:hypothetical protein